MRFFFKILASVRIFYGTLHKPKPRFKKDERNPKNVFIFAQKLRVQIKVRGKNP